MRDKRTLLLEKERDSFKESIEKTIAFIKEEDRDVYSKELILNMLEMIMNSVEYEKSNFETILNNLGIE